MVKERLSRAPVNLTFLFSHYGRLNSGF